MKPSVALTEHKYVLCVHKSRTATLPLVMPTALKHAAPQVNVVALVAFALKGVTSSALRTSTIELRKHAATSESARTSGV